MKAGRLFAYAIAAAVLTSAAAFPAIAGPDESIKARQEMMKSQGKALGPLVAIMKGEAAYDAATIKATVAAFHAAWETAKPSDPWAPDSVKGVTVETYAKPEIWSDPEGFKAAFANLTASVDKLAASTDEPSFKAAFAEVGNSCKGCHDKYRRPKD